MSDWAATGARRARAEPEGAAAVALSGPVEEPLVRCGEPEVSAAFPMAAVGGGVLLCDGSTQLLKLDPLFGAPFGRLAVM